jgi:hypothetical protein
VAGFFCESSVFLWLQHRCKREEFSVLPMPATVQALPPGTLKGIVKARRVPER